MLCGNAFHRDPETMRLVLQIFDAATFRLRANIVTSPSTDVIIGDSSTRTPFDLPRTAPRYHFYDSILLQVLQDRGELAEHVFVRFFDRNSVTRMFRFLDEVDDLRENLKLMSTVPIPTFLKAGGRIFRS